MANRSNRSPEKDQVIFESLREHPTFTRAAKRARIARSTLQKWRNEDSAFNAACEAAREAGMDALEDALIERGSENDTTAAIFMLKSWRRERYGDKQDVTQHGTIQHTHTHDLSRLSDDELAQLRTLSEKIERGEVAR